MSDTNIHLFEYLKILRRRKAWFIAAFVASVAVGVTLAILLPKTYRSSAT
ncbi:MAG: hypothetical protein H0W08_16075, partial [Acidobacteria bacterium]|nr:hypothetical protein [Acidobacteriota bacterium]